MSREIAALNSMLAELEHEDPLFLPSRFWSDLNRKNVGMLEAEGLANFKRTVSQNYFNWLISDRRHPLFRHVLEAWRKTPNCLPFLSRLSDVKYLRLTTSTEPVVLSMLQRHLYRLYVCFVWTIMQQHDRHGLRFKTSEPLVGNPFPVKYGRTLLSQDLANSIIECNVIADLTSDVARPKIAEVGAGYGRVAHTYLSSLPGQYYIFDIPPALAVAQWYLEQTLGRDKVFGFRHFDRLDDVREELDRSSVALFTPNQIKMFPDGAFDVMISISTLPEMRPEQVEFYVAEFCRLARRHVFLKQFKAWRNPDDGTKYTPDDYPFGSDWEVTLDREDPVIMYFFNRVWSRRR